MNNPCCEKLDEELAYKCVFEIMECIPFCYDKKIPPTVYIFNDGGHGGSYAIKYCPFCGTEIKL